MQALKLGLRDASWRGRSGNVNRRKASGSAMPRDTLAKAVLRFQCLDGTETHREAALYASQSGEARVGCVARTMEVEQFSRVLSRRSGERKGECLGSVEDEDTTAAGVELGKLRCRRPRQPTSRKAREVGHPRFRIGQSERRAAY